MLTVGLETLPGSIVEVMPAVLEHFGVALPPYARAARARMKTGGRAGGAPAQRGIGDERVLAAMAPCRASFRPGGAAVRAYDDRALPIGYGQTISQPFMVATICAALELDADARVLDVGTGSGYQAAVLAELAAEVVTIERVPELAGPCARDARAAGYDRVEVRVGDGTLGVPERAPFDGIAVAAAAPGCRTRSTASSRRGGRIVVPVGSLRDQWLEVVVRGADGPEVVRSVPCRFVPLVGAAGFDESASRVGGPRS